MDGMEDGDGDVDPEITEYVAPNLVREA